MQQNYYLIFSLNNRLYGINSSYVEEVLPLPELVLLPDTDCDFVGIFDLRGDLLPVLNLSSRLSYPHREYHLSDSLIVVKHTQTRLGIVVNKCLGIRTISSQEIVKSTSIQADDNSGILPSHQTEIIAGMTLDEDQILILHHLENWISISDVTAILDSVKQQNANAESDNGLLNSVILRPQEKLIFCPTATDEERAIFRNRAESLKVSFQTPKQTELQPIVVFILAGYFFGIDSDSVLEFVDLKRITPIPCCPTHIIGNANLRGEVLTVVDICKALNVPSSELSLPYKVMVVKVEGIVIGIVVDKISDTTFLLNVQDMVAATIALPGFDSTYLRGAVPYKENSSQFIGILNLPNLLLKGGLVVDELV